MINVPGQAGRALRFDLRPFLGLTGVAVAGPNRPHSVPPGRHGGNLDVSSLGIGSRLYLCVQVPGAGLYLGDPHFAQGNGEVALTAFEAPLRATLRVQLSDAASLPEEVARAAPFGETPEALIPIGLSEDLNEAMRECVRHALVLLEHRYALDRSTAYAYLSAATDFSVSQVVDVVKGIHACIKRTDLGELTDRWIGNKAEELTGKAKEAACDTADPSLEAEGRADQASGDVKQAGEKLADITKNLFLPG